jgi:hypothetical protein
MRSWRLTAALTVAAMAGCADTAPKTCEVSGTVTWNGQPLSEGTVIFDAADGAPVSDSGQVVAGKYRLHVKPGRKLVRFYADRETGKFNQVMGQMERESYIPERYNVRTEHVVDVVPGGKNRWDFALTGS